MSDSSKSTAILSPEEKRLLLAQLLQKKASRPEAPYSLIADSDDQHSEPFQCTTLIESLGIYLPEKVVSTEDVLRNCAKPVLFPLEDFTGIKSRRVVGEGEFSIDLAQKAISACLANSKYSPADIDLLICANCSRYDSPHYAISFEPSTSIRLKNYFGFKHALVFDITNACAGMFTAISIIDALIKAGRIRCGMVASGEYITHLIHTAQQEIEEYMDPRLACLTLGDAGAALILERSLNAKVGFHEIELFTLGRYSDFCIAGPTERAHGGAIMLTEMGRLTAAGIKHSVSHAQHMLEHRQRPLEAFQHIIPHQTSKLSIDEVAREINRQYNREVCTESTMICNLAERGNTASTSHFVALNDNILNNTIRSGESVIFSITASGLNVGTALYTFDDLPDRLRQMQAHPTRPHPARAHPVGAGEEGMRGGDACVALPGTTRHVWDEDVPKNLPLPGHPPSPLTLHDRAAVAADERRLQGGLVPRVRIESVGIVSDAAKVKRDTKDLAAAAVEDCLRKSAYHRDSIELLIHAGTYRSDFIGEPAVAATVVGSVGINDDIESQLDKKTFAFDVLNGGLGFLNACYIAIGMINAKKSKNALIVASEIENNAKTLPQELRGLKETGSALILEEDAGMPGMQRGFGNFVFKDFPSYIDTFTAHTFQERGKTYMRFKQDPNIEHYYLKCISETVAEVLTIEKLTISQINVFFPPQISSAFISRLSDDIMVSRDKFVDIVYDEKDFFTSSLAYALQYAYEQKLVKAGDIGLIINVGTGIQVGCAIYYF